MTGEKLDPEPESCSASAGRAGSAVTTASTSVGIEANLIQIEVCCTRSPQFFQIVGLTEAAAREARVRVVSALAVIGILLDEWAITINLAPLDLPKSGAALDLAIAIGVLAALGKLPIERAHATLLLGELSLAGSVRAVRGVLPKLEGARMSGVRDAIVPAGNACEAGLVKNIEVRVARDLEAVYAHLRGERELPRAPATEFAPAESSGNGYDFSDMRGQPAARRAIEVAAAGKHNLLMIGPPGGGKTLLARMLPSILPPLTFDEAFEATAVHSVAGLLNDERGMVTSRSFRAPHHSVSETELIGSIIPSDMGFLGVRVKISLCGEQVSKDYGSQKWRRMSNTDGSRFTYGIGCRFSTSQLRLASPLICVPPCKVHSVTSVLSWHEE